LSSVGELVEGKGFRELLEFYKKVRAGDVVLEDPSPPKDYISFLSRLDYSLWFWTSLSLALLALVSVVLNGFYGWVIYFRWVFGVLLVLFLPGYATIEALYPGEGELSSLERLALSIGLSLSLVPLIGLVLNYTPWGIRMNPVLASLTVYSIGLLLVAAYRKFEVARKSFGGRNFIGA